MNSATLVGYGALLQALTSVVTTRKTYHWIGAAIKDDYNKKENIDVPKSDIIYDKYILDDREVVEKLVRKIRWWVQPVRYRREQ